MNPGPERVAVAMKGLLVGGLLPALLFGVAGLLQKVASRAGIGSGPYLLCIGVGVLLVGGLVTLGGGPVREVSLRSVLASGAMGMAWALGTWGVILGIARYGVPLARLAPLYNMNTLVVVVLALAVFGEFRDLAVGKLLAGTALIMVGGVLVANA
ncbi:MAG: hypothetical protein R3D98_04910 [Candidatus Krumholzibacteriia bacterium]